MDNIDVTPPHDDQMKIKQKKRIVLWTACGLGKVVYLAPLLPSPGSASASAPSSFSLPLSAT